MNNISLLLKIGLCALGAFTFFYGALGALFVLGSNDGTPKIDALILVGVALVGLALLGAGIWLVVRKSR